MMKALRPNYTISIFALIFNITCCLISLAVMLTSKLMKGRGFQLLKCFLFNDLLASCLLFVLIVYHFVGDFLHIPEIMPTRRCFALFGLQYLFIFHNAVLTFLISVDRTVSVCFPRFYLHSIPGWFNVLLLVLSTVTSCSVYIAGLFDQFPTQILYFCTARGAAGINFAFFYWIISGVLSGTTCVVYANLLVCVRFKLFKSNIVEGQQLGQAWQSDALTKKKLELARKVTKVVAFTTICYIGVGPVQNLATIYIVAYLPSLASTVGTLFGNLSYVEGSMYTICLMMFVEDFRNELKSLFGLK